MTVTSSWKLIKNFTLDKDANKITFPTNHFSTWAMVAANTGETAAADMKPGDVNGDETVDLRDAILALQVCVKMSSAAAYKEADINGDGKIGLEEVIHIFAELMKPQP